MMESFCNRSLKNCHKAVSVTSLHNVMDQASQITPRGISAVNVTGDTICDGSYECVNITCTDRFLKFKDEQGNISSDDINTLITLYDAAHLRVHGEDILDNLITLNKSRLQALMETDLEADLLEEIRVTLETTLSRRVERVEARHFISVYEKATRDDTILEFAKLDYNVMQVVYCNELKELTV